MSVLRLPLRDAPGVDLGVAVLHAMTEPPADPSLTLALLDIETGPSLRVVREAPASTKPKIAPRSLIHQIWLDVIGVDDDDQT